MSGTNDYLKSIFFYLHLIDSLFLWSRIQWNYFALHCIISIHYPIDINISSTVCTLLFCSWFHTIMNRFDGSFYQLLFEVASSFHIWSKTNYRSTVFKESTLDTDSCDWQVLFSKNLLGITNLGQINLVLHQPLVL